MIVDCDRCVVRGDACGECVITVLLGAPPGGVDLDGADRKALDTLAAAGIVPRLQLVDCDEKHHEGRVGSGAERAGRCRAERSAGGGQRSERHVG